MRYPPWINAALSGVFPPLSSCLQPLRQPSCSATPSKCMSSVRPARNEKFELRDSFHYRTPPTSDITLKEFFLKRPHYAKLDTPMCCGYAACVNNTYLYKSGMDYTSHLKTFHNSWQLHDSLTVLWMFPKTVPRHTKLLSFRDYVANNTNTGIQHCFDLK